jgi:hypothetical protein
MSRSNFGPYQVFESGNNAMAGNLTSKISNLEFIKYVTYGISWSGTSPVGVLTVEVSNDYEVNNAGGVVNAGTWNALPFSDATGAIVTSVAISGNSGNGAISIGPTSYAFIRLVYTASSGTGTISALTKGKE